MGRHLAHRARKIREHRVRADAVASGQIHEQLSFQAPGNAQALICILGQDSASLPAKHAALREGPVVTDGRVHNRRVGLRQEHNAPVTACPAPAVLFAFPVVTGKEQCHQVIPREVNQIGPTFGEPSGPGARSGFAPSGRGKT